MCGLLFWSGVADLFGAHHPSIDRLQLGHRIRPLDRDRLVSLGELLVHDVPWRKRGVLFYHYE